MTLRESVVRCLLVFVLLSASAAGMSRARAQATEPNDAAPAATPANPASADPAPVPLAPSPPAPIGSQPANPTGTNPAVVAPTEAPPAPIGSQPAQSAPASGVIALPDATAPPTGAPPAGAPSANNPAAANTPAESTDAAPASAANAAPEVAKPAPPKPWAPRPILPPADPVAAAAFAVLDKHCARCHQGGRLTRPAPAANFGNILRLDEISRSPLRIIPGNPEGSRIYVQMLRQEMPYDVFHQEAAGPAPTLDEIGAVRDWIESLEPTPVCRDRRLVRPRDHMSALREEMETTDAKPATLRYVSIAHIYNSCASFEALKVYRQAIVQLVNSLSWRPNAIAVPAIDGAKTLFRIDLSKLGWLPEHWERIMRSGSDPLGLVPPLPATARKPFGTELPIVRADWLANTVLRAPLYYDVLGLPGTGPEILKILQVDFSQLQRDGGIRRFAVKPSAFGIGSGLSERVSARTGGLWTSYHVLAQDGAADLAEFATRPVSDPVPFHASRTMFMLPNGLPAYFMVGRRGDRLDALPPDIAKLGMMVAGELRAGLDCMSCHGKGPVGTLPPPAAGNAADSVPVTLREDQAAVASALLRLGLEPAMSLDGVEPMVALAEAHARPLSAFRAAAELGVPLARLLDLADKTDAGGAAILARRLVQGTVARADVEANRSALHLALAAIAGTEPTPQMANGPRPAPDPTDPRSHPAHSTNGVIVVSDKARYKKGDQLHLTVNTTTDCHLSLISVDQAGRGTVIFPSDFEASTLLTAGQELKLPGPSAPYTFRLGKTGRERIIALCNEVGATTDGIKHDFERQRFTDLGNYADFVRRNATATGELVDDRASSTSRRRSRGDTPKPAGPTANPGQIFRTGITIVVE